MSFPGFPPFFFFYLSLNKAKEDWGSGWGSTLLCEDQRESTTSGGLWPLTSDWGHNTCSCGRDMKGSLCIARCRLSSKRDQVPASCV